MGRNAAPRDNWTRVRFGDVVENVNDQPKRSTLPLDTRYIAGEHVDENRLTIDRWGTLGDDTVPPTFKRRFQPRDVLFHSRNLKKIAVPDFGGITGEKLFVLRTMSPVLLQEFLPYVLLARAFTAYAEASWSGSVNKFLNWTPLAKYEFDLPPIEEQLRQVGRLSAIRSTQEAHLLAAAAGAKVRASIGQVCETSGGDFPTLRIGQLVESMQYGVSCRPETHGSIPLLRMGNLRDGTLDTTDLKYTEPSEINSDRDLLKVGDVLFNRTNSVELVGKAALFELEGHWAFASYLVRLVPRRDLIVPEFLVAVINAAPVRARILANATKGVSQANVNTTNLANVTARIPPLTVQQRIVEALRQARHAEELLRERARRLPTIGTFLELEPA
jgi:type I restriction enzyme, S subunit